MAYRVKQQYPIEQELQRLLVTQLTKMKLQLDRMDLDPVDATHELRKAIKRTRAILRLLRPWLGKKAYHYENARMRQLSEDFSQARDADALLETFERLAPAVRSAVAEPVWISLNDAIRNSVSSVSSTPDSLMISDAYLTIHSAIERVKDFELPSKRRKYVKEFSRTYAQSRQQFLELRAHTAIIPESYHEWRKSVKDLLYQAQLLKEVGVFLSNDYHHAIDQLATALGDHHDAHMLLCRLIDPDNPIISRTQLGYDALFSAAQQSELTITTHALSVAKNLFALPRRSLLKEMGAGT